MTSPAAIGSITLTDDAARQALTGKTAEQTVASLDRDTGNAAGMSNLVQNAAVTYIYIQSLATEEVKHFADSLQKVKGTEDAESEAVRSALHAIVGCAGAAASGQNCGSGALGASGSVVLNLALNALQDTSSDTMTAAQKEERKKLVSAVLSGLAVATGGDAYIQGQVLQSYISVALTARLTVA